MRVENHRSKSLKASWHWLSIPSIGTHMDYDRPKLMKILVIVNKTQFGIKERVGMEIHMDFKDGLVKTQNLSTQGEGVHQIYQNNHPHGLWMFS